jgi:hypothetical protein
MRNDGQEKKKERKIIVNIKSERKTIHVVTILKDTQVNRYS